MAAYDAAGRLTELKRGTQTAGYAYDAANRVNATKLVNGIGERYGYDEANELTSIAYKNGSTTLGELDYSYDPNGDREAVWGSYARTRVPEAITAATYNADNEQTKINGTKLNTTKLSYDLSGNLIQTNTSQYKWDARSQLAGITGGSTASFAYDPFGRRITKTLAGITTKDLFDGANVVQEVTGGSTANLITGLGPDEILARTVGKASESYLTDALGSTIGLAGSTATVQTKYAYDPFGTTKLTGTASETLTSSQDAKTTVQAYTTTVLATTAPGTQDSSARILSDRPPAARTSMPMSTIIPPTLLIPLAPFRRKTRKSGKIFIRWKKKDPV